MTNINLRNFNLAQDWWKASILMALLIGVLFAGGYAASQGAQVSLSFDIQAQIKEIEERLDAPVNSSLAGMQKPYTEIISMVDSYYVRQNGTDGCLILPYSTNKTYVQQQSLGNVTTGSVYLKEMTLASGLTYGTTVLVIQQYQGQLSYYSNSALIYTVKSGSLNATVIYAGVLNASTNYVQAYRLLVENGTSFPSTASSGYVFFRTDWNLLTFYNGTGWTNCTTGSVDDLTVYLLKDGSRALTGDWNVGGSYGISGVTWLNVTNINLFGSLYYNQNQAVNMTFWSGTDFPSSPIAGQPFFRTDLSLLYYYNSTDWVVVEAGATGATGPAGTVHGLPFSYLIFKNSTATYMLNCTTGAIPFSSTNDSAVINAVNGNMTNGGEAYMRLGTYQIANVSLTNAAHWIGEDGCVWNLTNTNPCLTINAPTILENVQIYSVVSGAHHVSIQSDVTFRNVYFNLPMETGYVDGMIYSEATTPNNVWFDECDLLAGKLTAQYFTLFSSETNMTTLKISDFTVENVTTFAVDGNISACSRLFVIQSTSYIQAVIATNIIYDDIACNSSSVDDSSFIHTYGLAGTATLDGFYAFKYSFSGTLTDKQQLTPIGSCGLHQILNNIHLSIPTHIYGGYNVTEASNIYLLNPSTTVKTCGFDNVHGKLLVSNSVIDGASLDINTGITTARISNVMINGGRLWIGEEFNVPNSINVFATGVTWTQTSGLYGSAIEIGYDQNQMNLSTLSLDHCNFYNYELIFNCHGSPINPTFISMDHIVVGPRIDSGAPQLFAYDTRTNDNQKVSISDSFIVTKTPPLGYWGPPRINDRIHNTVFNNTSTNAQVSTYLSSPLYVVSGGTNNTIVDGGNNAIWISGTTYTNCGTPKDLYISGGTVTVIARDGQTLYTIATTCVIHLEPNDTFSITFSSAPTIVVFSG